MRRSAATLALLALLAGCGGGDDGSGQTSPPAGTTEAAAPPPTEREWAARAKPLCREYDRRANHALVRANPRGGDDLRANARVLRAVYRVLHRQVPALRKLPEPRPAGRVRRFLDRVDAAIDLLPEMARGFATGDTAAGARLFPRFERLGPELTSMARRLRVPGCVPYMVRELAKPG